MRRAGRIAVRHGTRHVFRQMHEKTAAAGDVELLHAQADRQQRQATFQQAANQQPVALVAALRQQLHRGMPRHTQAARIQVQTAAGQDEAIEAIEPGIEIDFLAQRRNHHG